MPRVLERADRIAAAMELRGYCENGPCRRGFPGLATTDLFGLALASAAVASAVLLRCWSLP